MKTKYLVDIITGKKSDKTVYGRLPINRTQIDISVTWLNFISLMGGCFPGIPAGSIFLFIETLLIPYLLGSYKKVKCSDFFLNYVW